MLMATKAMTECYKTLPNAGHVLVSMHKESATAVSLKYKKSKQAKAARVKTKEFDQAKVDFSACMTRRLEARNITVE